jgi:hypothetical protein
VTDEHGAARMHTGRGLTAAAERPDVGRLCPLCLAGYTCRRDAVDGRGCCDTTANSTLHLSCRGCVDDAGPCCNTFELCVSCCLRPEKARAAGVPQWGGVGLAHRLAGMPQVPILKSLLARATSLLMQRVEDRFELCMAQCRTSSASVVHENTYIDNEFKHCVQRPGS